ncbi:branched-chain amino acid ABC transporter permease [Paenibacillus chartarius]|uniref:Branched-chain amino acid ABC transporter permease n=1 Tax=Paenibacillus chartarius TaxID=747481 RepID=A0ABV6DHZ5_9BACL
MKKPILVSLVWLFFAAAPALFGDYMMHTLILILYFAFVSQAWNIMSGFSGQFSFGHAAFYGVGAYTSSILLTKFGLSPWLGMLAGAVLAILIGLMIGFLSFRYNLKGSYFALATLAFSEILRIIVQNTEYLNKTLGILIPLEPKPSMFQFESSSGYYYVIFAFVTLITLFVYKMSRSRLGFNLIAIRENENAAQSLGVNTYRNKMLAIALSAGLTAIGGTFYAQYLLFIEPPTAFGNSTSINILLPAIIGGAGTVLGPIVGSFLTVPLSEITSAYLGHFPGVHLIVYGIIVILVMLFLPEGLVGWVENRIQRHKAKKLRDGVTAAATTEMEVRNHVILENNRSYEKV